MDLPKLLDMTIKYIITRDKPSGIPLPQEKWYVGGELLTSIGLLDTLCLPGINYPNLMNLSIEYDGIHGQWTDGRDIWRDILSEMPALQSISIEASKIDALGKGWNPEDEGLLRSLPPLRRVRIVESNMSAADVVSLHRVLRRLPGWDKFEELFLRSSSDYCFDPPLEKVTTQRALDGSTSES